MSRKNGKAVAAETPADDGPVATWRFAFDDAHGLAPAIRAEVLPLLAGRLEGYANGLLSGEYDDTSPGTLLALDAVVHALEHLNRSGIRCVPVP